MYARAGAKEGLRRFIEAVSLVLWRVGFRRRNVLPVLTYHDVLPASRELEDPCNSIPEDRFELQIRELARNGYAFYTVSDGLAMLRRSGGKPERRVALTFDDGTEGHARIVTPALLRLGATATFYLISTGFGEEVTVGTRRGKHMSVQDAADMARCGMEMGAHSRTHPILSRLSLDGIREEVAGAREEIAKLMGRAPRSFSRVRRDRVGAHVAAERGDPRPDRPTASSHPTATRTKRQTRREAGTQSHGAGRDRATEANAGESRADAEVAGPVSRVAERQGGHAGGHRATDLPPRALGSIASIGPTAYRRLYLMRAAFSLGGAARHGLVALAEGLVVAGIIAALLLALSPIYAPARLISGTDQTYAA